MMNEQSRKKSDRGIGLIEVLITVAILGAVALAIGTLTQQTSLLSGHFQSQAGRSALQTVVQSVLSQDSLCDALINTGVTVNLPTPSDPGITNLVLNLHDATSPAPNTIIGANSNLLKFDLRIPANGFQFVIPAGTSGLSATPDTIWTGLVELEAEKLRESAGGQSLARKSLGSLTVRVNSSNNLVGCEGFTVSGSAACTALGGTWTAGACQFPSTYPCSDGQILTGSNIPTDCRSCPANQVLVFNGGGGFNCLPYP